MEDRILDRTMDALIVFAIFGAKGALALGFLAAM